MPRLIWSQAAQADMQRLFRFLANHNRSAASRAVRAIRAGVAVIAKYPGIGRPFEGMASEYREWLVAFGDSGYMVLYRYDGETALITAIRHQRELG